MFPYFSNILKISNIINKYMYDLGKCLFLSDKQPNLLIINSNCSIKGLKDFIAFIIRGVICKFSTVIVKQTR